MSVNHLKHLIDHRAYQEAFDEYMKSGQASVWHSYTTPYGDINIKENNMATYSPGGYSDNQVEVSRSIEVKEEPKQIIELPVNFAITKVDVGTNVLGNKAIKVFFRMIEFVNDDGIAEPPKYVDRILYLVKEGEAYPNFLRGASHYGIFEYEGKTYYAFIN